MTAGNNPIHKATIMPRGRALGMVATLPEGDQTSMSKKQMSAFMDMVSCTWLLLAWKTDASNFFLSA
jgi:ATP-dependent Zn protease